MRNQRSMLFAAILVFLSACSDHGTNSTVAFDEGEKGAIVFRILKNETPANVWVIETRLDREGYATLKDSVFVRAVVDTIRIKMNNVPAGYWSVTVLAKDSVGIIRYSGNSSVLIVENQTVLANVQMNPVGGTGSLQIVVAWQPGQPQLQLRTAGSIFFVQRPIQVSITNSSRVIVNLASCCTRPDLRVQRKLDGGWSPPGECELKCPSILLPLKPGATMSDSLVWIAQPGVYRLMLRYSDLTPGISPAVFAVYSNEFKVLSTQTDSTKLGEEFGLKFGDKVTLRGTDLTLAFKDVTEDSRCPEGAVCVWAGNARILLGVNQTAIALNTTLEPKQASYSSYVIQLLGLYPYPKVDRQIKKEEYIAALIVTVKR